MASIFEIDNDTPLEHTCSNGLTFKAEFADLRTGVTVVKEDFWFEDALKMGKDFAEFGAWHCLEIRPNLNGFAGYDAIQYTIEDPNDPKYVDDISDMDGDLMTVEEFKGACSVGAFIDYDGFGYAVKDNKAWVRDMRPSLRHNIPDDATHILWFNR